MDDDDNDMDTEETTYNFRHRHRKNITFPTLSNRFLVWIYDIWVIDSNTFYAHAGFDALVFRLFLKGCVYICLASLPYALLVLLPVYGTSELKNEAKDTIDLISLNTVSAESPRLYAAVIGSYVFSLIALYYLSKVYLAVACATDQFFIGSRRLDDIDHISWFNYRKAINNVIDFNVNLAKGQDLLHKTSLPPARYSVSSHHDADATHFEMQCVSAADTHSSSSNHDRETLHELIPPIDRYTVMIRNLPKQFQDQTTLTQLMTQLFAHKIAQVVVVPNVNELDNIHSQIKYHQKQLKQLSVKHDFNLSNDLYDDDRLPEVLEGRTCSGCCGEKINLIQYHRANKDALISKFIKIKKAGLSATPTAFVIFNSLVTAAHCTLRVSKAPYPNDLYWNNLQFKPGDLVCYNVLVGIAIIFLLIFWSIPVAAIQGLANLETLFRLFGGDVVKTLGSQERVATVQGALAVFILDLWLGILPVIGEILTTLQRKPYRGRHETCVLIKYFDQLVFMVLLVTVVAGSTLNGANDLKDYAQNMVHSISDIAQTLADGLSDMSVYFMLYVLLNAFLWLPVELYRPSYFMYKKLNLAEANRFRYSVWYPKTMLIFTIVLTYSVVNPIMWILGLVYFVFATVVFTYNLSMSWVPEFETGAKQWPLVFGRLRFAFMISIFTLIGWMTLTQAYVCAVLLLPLAGIVWAVTGNINVKFRTMFRVTSLTSAQRKDKQITRRINYGDEGSSKHLGDAIALTHVYLPPIMSINYTKHKAVYVPPELVQNL
eukprot:92295_1